MTTLLKLVIFDMAGTTIEDKGQVPTAFKEVLQTNGFAVTDDEVHAVRGASKREAIRLLIDQRLERQDNTALAEQTYTDFRKRLQKIYQTEGVRFIDGTLTTFGWLRNKGIKIALNTGFDRLITDNIVENLAWKDQGVDAIICGDDVKLGRPAPYLIFHAMERTSIMNVRQVMNVGDTVRDLQSGFYAGVKFNVAVLSGAHSPEQLREEPHTHLLSSVADLPTLLR